MKKKSYAHKYREALHSIEFRTYISVKIQDLEACKKSGYEFYCEELFVVKHRTQHNCESAIYFDLGADIIKEKL